MRTEEKRNSRISDVVKRYDGDLFVVTKVSGQEISLAPAKEDEAGLYHQVEGADAISVPAGTFDEYFTLMMAAPAETPNVQTYLVENGELYHDGELLDTGSREVVEIKAACAGHLILSVTPEKQPGREELVSYNVETGKIFSFGLKNDRFTVIHSDDHHIVVIAIDNRKVMYPDRDGVLKEGETLARTCHVINTEEEDPYLGATYTGSTPDIGEYEVLPGSHGISKIIVFASNRSFDTVETDTGDFANVLLPETGRYTATVVLLRDRGSVGDRVAPFDGRIKKIIPCHDGWSVVFVTDRGIVHSNFGHFYRQAVGKKVLEAVKNHPLPLKLEVVNEQKTVFTFADPATYKIAVITVEKAKDDDSGFHTSVEYK